MRATRVMAGRSANWSRREQFAPYAALIVLPHVSGVSSAWTAGAVATVFRLRIIHSVVKWAGISVPIRPVLFCAFYICIPVLGWQALTV